ncbi:MFS transporter [Fibrobacterota bacterium]
MPDSREITDPVYNKNFLLLFAFGFLSALSFTCSPVYPLYVAASGGDAATIGWFMGIAPLTAVASRLFIGPLIDTWGAKRILQLGSFFLAVPPLVYLLTVDEGLVGLVWFFRIVHGAGWGAYYTSFFTLAGKLSPELRRNEALSMYGIASITAAMLGPLTGEWLVNTHGFRPFFALLSGLNFSALALLAFIPSPARETSQSPRQNDTAAWLKTPGLLLFVFTALLFTLAIATPRNFMAPFAHSRGIIPFAPYFTVFSLANIIARLAGGKLGDRLGQEKILIPSCLVYGLGLFSISISHNFSSLMLAGLLCGISNGLAFPAMMALSYKIAAKQHTGKVMALITGMMDAGSGFNAFLLGIMASKTGYGTIFYVPIISIVMVAIILLGQIKRTR